MVVLAFRVILLIAIMSVKQRKVALWKVWPNHNGCKHYDLSIFSKHGLLVVDFERLLDARIHALLVYQELLLVWNKCQQSFQKLINLESLYYSFTQR